MAFDQRAENETVQLTVQRGNITSVAVDVVAVKHAQNFYGADLAVARCLREKGISEARFQPNAGEHALLFSNDALSAPRVLFVGTPSIESFTYDDVRDLARNTLKILRNEAPDTRSLAMTIHGPGFGLDEIECAEQQLEGFRLALSLLEAPKQLRQIILVERDPQKLDFIERVVKEFVSDHRTFHDFETESAPQRSVGSISYSFGAGTSTLTQPSVSTKQRVFVAMPFAKDMRDVWTFGIQQPVRDLGLLCERLDQEAFTGDILSRIKSGIDQALLVIADLTGCNPNVFLEVGYAWGKNQPTLLLCRDAGKQSLPFDVSGQRCLWYEDAIHLSELLRAELVKLRVVVR